MRCWICARALCWRVTRRRGLIGRKADAYLTGIGTEQPAYQLFLGMRVRLLAEAVRGRLKKGESVKAVRGIARGGHILYRLWHDSDCLPGCPRSNRLAVHRAAFEIALMGRLNSSAFGLAWGGFVNEGGDIRPFVKTGFGLFGR